MQMILLGILLFAQGYVPPHLPGGPPDIQGIWQVMNTANWDLQDHTGAYKLPAGFSVVEGGEIPYKPEALAKRKENFAKRLTEDPVEKCYLAGVPRTTYLPYPFQILQTGDTVVLLSEYVHTWRWIPTKKVDRYEGYDSWMGDSRGHWEGNTLVVETAGFNDSTWLDHSGNYHSDALKVTERFTRTSADTMDYEATIDDSKVFTRPWKIRMPLHRNKDMVRVLEDECYLAAEEAGRK